MNDFEWVSSAIQDAKYQLPKVGHAHRKQKLGLEWFFGGREATTGNASALRRLRLFRIAGLRERTSRWVVMEQLTFIRIFGSTLHRFFAAFILWIMLILVNFERSLLPAQVNISPSVTFQSEDNQSTLGKGIPPSNAADHPVVKDLSKHTTQWYESQLITTELLFEARKLKKWILWILSEQFVV